MKTIIIFPALVTAIAIQLSSCKKPQTESPQAAGPQTQSMTERRQLIQALSDPTQTFYMDASRGATIRGKKGTVIRIPALAFLNPNGSTCKENISIRLKEVLTKKDMICNNALPMSNGRLLVSGGQIYLTAWDGAQQLQTNPAANIRITIPTRNYEPMQLFSSRGSDDLSDTDLNWQLRELPVAADSFGYTYLPGVIRENWTNCDYYYEISGPKTSVSYSLSGPFNHTNTMVMLSMDGMNSVSSVVAELDPAAPAAPSQTFVNRNIPLNQNFTLVAISLVGGTYYYMSRPFVSSANLNVALPPLSPTTISQINNNLSALP